MKKTLKFSTFLISVVMLCESITLLITMGVFYSVFTVGLQEELSRHAEAKRVDIGWVLKNRMDGITAELKRLSLRSELRSGLVQSEKSRLMELLSSYSSLASDTFFVVYSGSMDLFLPIIPFQSDALQPFMIEMSSRGESLSVRYATLPSGEFIIIFAAPVMEGLDRYGTVYAVYSLERDRDMEKHLRLNEDEGLFLKHTFEYTKLFEAHLSPHERKKYTFSRDSQMGSITEIPNFFYIHSNQWLKEKKYLIILLLSGIGFIFLFLTFAASLWVSLRVRHFLDEMVNRAQKMVNNPSQNELAEEDIRFIEFQHLFKSFKEILGNLLSTQHVLKMRTEYLYRSEKRYRNILESIEDGYYEVDLKGNMMFCNDAMAKMLGYARAEILGINYKSCVDEISQKKVFEALNEVYRTGEPIKGIENEIFRKDKSSIIGEISATLIRNKSGEGLGFRGILRDVTQRRKAEELKGEKLKAEASSRAKSEFLAHMSHEIRTPLNGVLGMVEVIMSTRLDENQLRFMAIIEQEASHLLRIINEILDFEKIESGKLVLEKTRFDLYKLMDSIGEGISLKAFQKNLEMNVFVSPDLPRYLMGDPTRLRQILDNLSSNSVKFTESGEIIIRSEPVISEGERVKIRFEVKDTGIGIAEAHLEKVFESFTQADESITRRYGGTGLGTTISKHLVELMGGHIQLRSKEKEGTMIWFDLWFEISSERGDVAESIRCPIGLKVLVVDDCRTSRMFASKYLSVLGGSVTEAVNGDDALVKIKNSLNENIPFDLILTDFKMPGMSGYELVQKIRSLDQYLYTPVIAVSGIKDIAEGEDLSHWGFSRCIAKPLKIDDLINVITTLCASGVCLERLATEDEPVPIINRNAKILIVDDYLTNQQVVNMHLTSKGYSVELADNGEMAVSMALENHYDLILMDIEMPVIDGYEATLRIRKRKDKVPIIALTAHALKGQEEKALKSGMNDYLIKPLKRDILLEKVDYWLSSRPKENEKKNSSESTVIYEEPTEITDKLPINWKLALEEFMGERALLMDILDTFQNNMRQQIETIEEALLKNDSETVRREAHAIKGGALNIRAEYLSQAAENLERMGKLGTLENGREALAHICLEVDRLKHFLKEQGDR